jgi:MFS transporter, DHA1 family, multidrug resistance protein
MTNTLLSLKLHSALGLPSDNQRARATLTLLVDNLLMWGGFFMIIPLVSVHYVKDLGWTASLVGIVLAVRQFSQQGITVFSGALADRFGAKGLILLGLLVRALGFASMAWAETFPLLLGSAFLAGLGGALFDSPKSAAMAALSDESSRRRMFAVQGVSGNVGMALGVLAGGLLIRASFDVVAIVSGACYLAAFLITLPLLPHVRVSLGQRGLLAGLGMAVRDRRFVTFVVLSTGYFLLWSQMGLGVSLKAEDLTSTEQAITWVFLTNTAVAISLQYPLLRWLEPRLSPLQGLILGTALMSLGLGFISFASTIGVLLGCVAVYAVGSLILSPNQQTMAVELANHQVLGSYMGLSSLGLAVGGSLGNFVGGALYDLGKRLAFDDLAWLILFAIGTLTVLGIFLFGNHYGKAS